MTLDSDNSDTRHFKPAKHRAACRRSAACNVLSSAVLLGSTALTGIPAFAAIELPMASHALSFGALQTVSVIGMAVFATTTALLHIFGRRGWNQREASLVAELAREQSRNDRISAMVSGDHQIIISWLSPCEPPLIEGEAGFSIATGALAFGSWAVPQSALALERHVDQLKSSGESFLVSLITKNGQIVEAAGQAVGGRAVLRLRDISGVAAELKQVAERLDVISTQHASLLTLINSMPHPVWTRSLQGTLTWANEAYLAAVEASSLEQAEAKKLDLLDKADRDAVAQHVQAGDTYGAQVHAIVAGQRCVLDVMDKPTSSGRAGIAIDVTALEDARRTLQQQMEAHAVTLDRLPTAVAIFDNKQALVFRNAAFEKLWGFDVAFLDSKPLHGQLLDLQRDGHKVPNLAEYKSWKSDLLAIYESSKTSEDYWLLPDGRTIHCLTTPNPQGGITALFDDVTEGASLKFQVSTLDRVQQETLDALREGVAVFGSDGRLKLSNPAFALQWRLDPEMLAALPHVDSVVTKCRLLAPGEDVWTDLLTAVAGVRDERHDISARFERRDGSILDCTATALPDGGTMITFVDVTDSVNVERALTEKAEALEKAARLRDDFVHKVSYELRSPLTNVIGFAQILGGESIGALNERQRDYTSHILRSAGVLLAIVNDILDLASIDNGDLALDLKPVDIMGTITAVNDSLADRLSEKSVSIEVEQDGNLGELVADSRRVRQVLYNLLANAVAFSSSGQIVKLRAWRDGNDVAFTIADQGRGIPQEVQDKIFGRFESHGIGAQYRGVGLGLAIVKSLVELHGGNVELVSRPGDGTRVTCRFPASGVILHQAAE
jgi:signal transduction histidine kinase